MRLASVARKLQLNQHRIHHPPRCCRCRDWRRRAHNTMRFLTYVHPISMACAVMAAAVTLTVEAKVIGNSVHFNFILFLFYLFVFRIASSLSLVCRFNFGHDPIFTWRFSSRHFGESNIECIFGIPTKYNNITITIMCTRRNDGTSARIVADAAVASVEFFGRGEGRARFHTHTWTYTVHVHIYALRVSRGIQVIIMMNVYYTYNISNMYTCHDDRLPYIHN